MAYKKQSAARADLRRRRAQWRKEGRCGSCGSLERPVVPGTSLCETCLLSHRARSRRYMQRVRGGLKALGICSRCRDAEAMPGSGVCGACSEAGAEAKARHRLRKLWARPSAVYVAGSYTAPTQEGISSNVALALRAGARLASDGHLVIVPHAALPPHLSWEVAMNACKRLLLTCHAIVLLPNWASSRGARQEREWAETACIPVFHLSDVAPDFISEVSLDRRPAC